jgi:hypothetical protein
MQKLKKVDPKMVAHCANFSDAIHLAMSQTPEYRTHQSWADLLGMRVSDFTCVVNSDYGGRKRYLDPNKIPVFVNECGNLALVQWLEMATFGMLECQKKAAPPKQLFGTMH